VQQVRAAATVGRRRSTPLDARRRRRVAVRVLHADDDLHAAAVVAGRRPSGPGRRRRVAGRSTGSPRRPRGGDDLGAARPAAGDARLRRDRRRRPRRDRIHTEDAVPRDARDGGVRCLQLQRVDAAVSDSRRPLHPVPGGISTAAPGAGVRHRGRRRRRRTDGAAAASRLRRGQRLLSDDRLLFRRDRARRRRRPR